MSELFGCCAIKDRFRGYLPIVVDVETGGFNSATDALLEIAAVILRMDANGYLHRDRTYACNVLPFPGANLEPSALEFTGIPDPFHPFREAKQEGEALQYVFAPIRAELKRTQCIRAILVGHNAPFDQGFLNAVVARTQTKRNPFHPFSSLDTVSLSALMYGQTVLAKALACAGLEWNQSQAHSASYDAEKTADLFCIICNRWQAITTRETTTK